MQKNFYDKLNKTVYFFQFKDFSYKNKNFNIPEGQINYHRKNFKKFFNLKKKEIPNLKILETGCGPGTHAVILSLMGFKKVLAADKLSSNIRIANARKKKFNLKNINFKTHDFSKNKKISNEKFDLIACHNWLQHSPNPQKIIIHLLNSLKLGGKLYISTYTSNTFRHYISFAARKILQNVKFSVFIKKIKKIFPKGFAKYSSNQICLTNITDDFFTPYIFTSTYKNLITLGRKIGLNPITKYPKKLNYFNTDTHQLKVGFIKKKEFNTKEIKNLKNFFNNPNFEFKISSIKDRDYCNIILKKIFELIKDKSVDNNIKCLTALKLYKIRAELHRKNKSFNRYKHFKKKLKNIYNALN